MSLADIVHAFEESTISSIINQSRYLLGGLSGLHLIGLTLIVGAALVSGLRLTGWLMPDRPIEEITRPAFRAMAIGLAINITTGLLLVGPRAHTIIEGGAGIFTVKMALLAVAIVLHAGVRLMIRLRLRPSFLGPSGALSTIAWLSVAVAGCAFILLE
jgi:hypothetical protein